MKPQRHHRVAFPLAHVPVSLKALRPKEYVDNPQTLAQHLKKRRALAGLLQRQVAAEMGVEVDTYRLWEQGHTSPTVGSYPAVIRFLGYDPAPEGMTLPERLKRKRWQLGLTTEQAAAFMGINESTFLRWETGQGRPVIRAEAIDRFFNAQ